MELFFEDYEDWYNDCEDWVCEPTRDRERNKERRERERERERERGRGRGRGRGGGRGKRARARRQFIVPDWRSFAASSTGISTMLTSWARRPRTLSIWCRQRMDASVSTARQRQPEEKRISAQPSGTTDGRLGGRTREGTSSFGIDG